MHNKIISSSALLLFFQFLAHIALLTLLFYGTLADLGLCLLVFFLMSCLGTTMTTHRWLAHRSWEPPRWFQYLGIAFSTLSLMGSPLSWVVLHRKHHQAADTEEDPHSPQFKPWWKVHAFIMYAPFGLSSPRDLLRMPLLLFVHRWYFLIHGIVLAALCLIGWWWAVVLYLAPAALTWQAGAIVVSLNHLRGYRNFNTADNSHNNFLTGWVTWGEGWHNNHHADPNNPSFSIHWWEVDVGGLLIQFFSRRKVQVRVHVENAL